MSTVVLLFFLVALIIFITLAGKIASKLFAFVTWKKSAILTGVYLVCLILSVGLVAILPNSGFLKSEKNEQVGNPHSDISKFFDVKTGKDLDQQKELYLNNRQTLKTDQASLRLDLSPDSGYIKVFVERKAEDDSKIDIFTYLTPFTIGKLDYTKFLEPPKVSLQDNLLSIKSVRQNFALKLYKTNLTQSQFREYDALDLQNNSSTAVNFGWGAVLLKIPKSLAIDEGNSNIQFLEKD
jgi:hypothetical protein